MIDGAPAFWQGRLPIDSLFQLVAVLPPRGIYLVTNLSLTDAWRAWQSRDPQLVDVVLTVADQDYISHGEPVREGAVTFQSFIASLRSPAYLKKSPEEREAYRRNTLQTLEQPTAEVPLNDRERLHEILLELWNSDEPFARESLLQIIATIDLVYGPWKAIKRIFKEAEARRDTEMFGAICARLDMAFSRSEGRVSKLTQGYLVRRGWRFLRRLATDLPAAYADTAVNFLIHYTDRCQWPAAWIINHIFFHEEGRFGARSFKYGYRTPSDTIKDRAFADLWKRTPRPLFSLLERAQCDRVRDFAVRALQQDFRVALREVEASWVSRLVAVDSTVVHEFVIWLLDNAPRFEQAAFRELDLHVAVLRLLDSDSRPAAEYAAKYARTHARDIPVAELVRLAGNPHNAVRKLAQDLLQSLDPRAEVGLNAWGRLLEGDHTHKLAAKNLRNHFGASELTPSWFAARLRSGNQHAFNFAQQYLTEIHSRAQLGSAYFTAMVVDLDVTPVVSSFAAGELRHFDANKLPVDFLQKALLRATTRDWVSQWINEGRLHANKLPVEFLHALAFHPDFETSSFINRLFAEDPRWREETEGFSEDFSYTVLSWLGDDRRFKPAAIGFEWLMQLACRSEPRYHDFAVETLVRSFAPADFAPSDMPSDAPGSALSSAPDSAAAGSVQRTLAGCEYLWQLATSHEPGSEPQAEFAMTYFRRRHPDISQRLTGVALDTAAALPNEFVSFERFNELLFDDRPAVRDFALDFAQWEFARWAPPLTDLVLLVESPHEKVRNFVAQTLLAEDVPETRSFRLDPAGLTPEAVYTFCESRDDGARALGVRLIQLHPRLRVPDELFRLTQSPDRKVRSFAIAALWSLYHSRGITAGWKPTAAPADTADQAAPQKSGKKSRKKPVDPGVGAPPQPAGPPSGMAEMNALLRRILFEIPPARLPKSRLGIEGVSDQLKPLPARKAKMALIETVRDLALQDNQFADVCLPLLEEFMFTRGQSEQAASLVAVTQIRNRWQPEPAPRA